MKKYQLLMIILAIFTLLFVSCKTIEPIFYKTVELTVAWDPNTEADMSHYNLYRVYQGKYKRINERPIRHPTKTFSFTLKVPNDFNKPLCFVVTAIDTSRNESGYSNMACGNK
ncbi:MAG: hypothetical protein GTN76_15310 [Candidatus Aenigmarchaeota archaeon]|nr:hypothetical protein [Candidatus Aenigmarchaeota archaeon]